MKGMVYLVMALLVCSAVMALGDVSHRGVGTKDNVLMFKSYNVSQMQISSFKISANYAAKKLNAEIVLRVADPTVKYGMRQFSIVTSAVGGKYSQQLYYEDSATVMFKTVSKITENAVSTYQPVTYVYDKASGTFTVIGADFYFVRL